MSMWERSRGKTQATPRATEPAPGPPAATPVAGGAKGNTAGQTLRGLSSPLCLVQRYSCPLKQSALLGQQT